MTNIVELTFSIGCLIFFKARLAFNFEPWIHLVDPHYTTVCNHEY